MSRREGNSVRLAFTGHVHVFYVKPNVAIVVTEYNAPVVVESGDTHAHAHTHTHTVHCFRGGLMCR